MLFGYSIVLVLVCIEVKTLFFMLNILGFVVVGYHNGTVKSFVVRRYEDDGSISIGKSFHTSEP